MLCGPSGCGKSTLLRQLKTVLAPHGRRSGEILFDGRNLDSLDQREQAETIGFVQQSPENQIATDKVWHELSFGLESLGYDTPTIRRRVAEMASFFGIQTWFYKSVTELSGGQKQLLNLASVMVLQPKVLILDEPASQLDPIAASDFLATLGKINRELGTTIILTEHRLEEAFGFASRVAVMDGGRLLCTGTPAEVGAELKSSGNAMFLAMPAAMRIWAASDSKATCPISVCDGRNWLLDYAKTHELRPVPEEKKKHAERRNRRLGAGTLVQIRQRPARRGKRSILGAAQRRISYAARRQRHGQNDHAQAAGKPAKAVSRGIDYQRQRRDAAAEPAGALCEILSARRFIGDFTKIRTQNRAACTSRFPLQAGGAAGPPSV